MQLHPQSSTVRTEGDLLFKTHTLQNIKGRPYVTYQAQYFFIYSHVQLCTFRTQNKPVIRLI